MGMYRWSLVAIIVLMIASPVFAHHGTAAYDTTQTITVNGTVTDFEFGNPHVLIFFDVTGNKGVEKWEGELTSPNHLARSGWTKHTFKPGDQVTFSGLRAKSGATTLWITKIVGADGREIALSPAD